VTLPEFDGQRDPNTNGDPYQPDQQYKAGVTAWEARTQIRRNNDHADYAMGAQAFQKEAKKIAPAGGH